MIPSAQFGKGRSICRRTIDSSRSQTLHTRKWTQASLMPAAWAMCRPARTWWCTISSPPHQYIAANWPLQHAALSSDGVDIAVAGRRGLALFSRRSARWRLFGDVSQEKGLAVHVSTLAAFLQCHMNIHVLCLSIYFISQFYMIIITMFFMHIWLAITYHIFT